MKNIVFDSYALLALLEKEKGHGEISQLLSDIANSEKHGFLSVINAGEIYYITHRKRGVKQAELALSAVLQFPLELAEADFTATYEAAKLKAKYKISYADAFAAALTIKKKATLVTGDKEFRHLEGETNFKVKFI